MLRERWCLEISADKQYKLIGKEVSFWSRSIKHVFNIIYKFMKKKTAELQLLKKIWLWSSSVIKIVKMKYNRIDIKWWHVSTSFKIYIEMLSPLYITFTVFYNNIASLKTLSKRIIQFTCNAVNTHLTLWAKVSIFITLSPVWSFHDRC